MDVDELAGGGSMLGDERKTFDHEWSNTSVIDLAIRLALLGLLGYLALSILRPLLGMIIWSVVLAVALYPIFEWLAAILGGRRRLAAVIVAITSISIVLGPVTWLVLSLVESLQVFSRHLELGDLSLALPIETVKSWPLIFRSWVSNLRLQTETGFSRNFIFFSPKKGAHPWGGQALFWREEYVLQHRQSHGFLPPLSHRLDHQVSLQGFAGKAAGAGEGHHPTSLS
jgi:hypothetical protein